MRKILFYGTGVVIALIFGIGAYAIVVGPESFGSPAEARFLEMPANPHIIYLAPQGTSRGLVNEKSMQARGATSNAQNWQAARLTASQRPVDALLIEASILGNTTPLDEEWLRVQFRDGVAIVGMGVEDDRFARVLGLQTLLAPTEASIPIGPTGYRLVMSLVLGTPDDVRTLESTDWINQAIRGEERNIISPSGKINNVMINSFSKSRGRLDSVQELDTLFLRLTSVIENAYKLRAEFQQRIKK